MTFNFYLKLFWMTLVYSKGSLHSSNQSPWVLICVDCKVLWPSTLSCRRKIDGRKNLIFRKMREVKNLLTDGRTCSGPYTRTYLSIMKVFSWIHVSHMPEGIITPRVKKWCMQRLCIFWQFPCFCFFNIRFFINKQV